MIDPDLLEILACPLDDERPPLRQEGDWLVCTVCGAKFPIVDGIPHLIAEAAVMPDAPDEPADDHSSA